MNERPELTTEETKVRAERTEPRRKPGPSIRGRVVDAATRVISLVTTAVVIVLAIHIVFVAFEANLSNSIVGTIGDWAEALAWQFKDLFAPENPKVAVFVNYGVAATVYLIVGRILAGLVRRAG